MHSVHKMPPIAIDGV